jgi:hypothetical protein
VVYDAAQRTVVAREALRASRQSSAVVALTGDDIFVRGAGSEIYRYTLGTSGFDEVDAARLEGAIRAAPRALVHESSGVAGRVLGSGGADPNFSGYEPIDVRGSVLGGLFDAHTGQPVELRLPSSYEYDDTSAWFVQRLDDDRFAVLTGASGAGDLLVCGIDAGRCTVAIDEATWLESVPPLIPGNGASGAEYALGAAVHEQS